MMYEIKITKLSETSVHVTDGNVKRVMSNPEEWTNRFNPILIFRDFLKMLGCKSWSVYPYMYTEKVLENERVAIYKYGSLFKVKFDEITEYALKHKKKIYNHEHRSPWKRENFSLESDNKYHIQSEDCYKSRIISDFEIVIKEVNDNA